MYENGTRACGSVVGMDVGILGTGRLGGTTVLNVRGSGVDLEKPKSMLRMHRRCGIEQPVNQSTMRLRSAVLLIPSPSFSYFLRRYCCHHAKMLDLKQCPSAEIG